MESHVFERKNRAGAFLALMLLAGTAAEATHPCTSPLVLAMDGTAPLATNPSNGVDFDINGDGVEERIGWPVGDAFLWLDLNHNGVVDNGTELFGTSSLLPSGEYAENGFEALAAYDRPQLGGNGDGLISPSDLVWASLRLWVDSNRDGTSQREEISTLPAEGVVWIGLHYILSDLIDGGGNLHAFRGAFGIRHRELGAWKVHEHLMDDIYFAWMPTAE